MADATNEVRLYAFRSDETGHVSYLPEGEAPYIGVPVTHVGTFIARPVADDDAREERLHAVEVALDEAGVARSNAPSADACTSRDTPERYPRLTLAERVKILAKSEKDILDRLIDAGADAYKATRDRDEWKARAEKAEAEVAQLRDAVRAERDVLVEESARAEKAEAERDSARALLREAVPSIERALMACDSNQLRVMYTQLLARIAGLDAELGGGK